MQWFVIYIYFSFYLNDNNIKLRKLISYIILYIKKERKKENNKS